MVSSRLLAAFIQHPNSNPGHFQSYRSQPAALPSATPKTTRIWLRNTSKPTSRSSNRSASRRGMSREKLAAKAIVSPRTLDSIMAGKQAAISTFSKLAKALDAPVESILEGYEDPDGSDRTAVEDHDYRINSF